MGALPEFGLEDRVVVVTGAGRGIGRAIAVDAACSGALVIGCSRTAADLDALDAEIRDAGGRSRTVVADASTAEGVERVLDCAVTAAGRVDGVVNNAGTNRLKPALDYTDEEIDSILDANLRSVYRWCVAAAEQMIAQGTGGSIVNVTSQAGIVGAPERAPYSAAKAGVNNLSRTLAAEWAGYGIRVNALAPTVTMTPLGVKAMADSPEFAEEVRRKILLGRPAEVREISLPAIFLLTDAAAMITGHVLAVDGGWTAV